VLQASYPYMNLRFLSLIIAAWLTLSLHHLPAQCEIDNSLCVGGSSDCQGKKYTNPFGSGTVEFASGIPNYTSTGYLKFETFNTEVQHSAKIEPNTDLTFVRQGSESMKSSIWKPTSGDTARAELGDGGLGLRSKKDPAGNDYYYWYGWSYYTPDDASWASTTLRQFIGQFRFYNVGNCVTMKTCANAKVGGSGHHLMLSNGRLIMTLEIADTACAISGRLKTLDFDLGAPVKGKWMDFMIQARWSETANGKMTVWIQKNNAGYEQVMDYTGPTWIKTYNVDAACSVSGEETPAPGWQLGLYWANERPATESLARYIYTDAARCNRTICADGKNSEAWNRTLPAPEGTAPPPSSDILQIEMENLSYTTSSGDSVSNFTDTSYASGNLAVKVNTNAVNDFVQTTRLVPIM
jgi:hypothetical protein